MNTIYNPITCYLPDNFALEDILCYNKRWKEKYIYFIHTIVFRSLRDKGSFSGFVNLPQVILQHLLGSKYSRHIINQLVNSGVIEINKSYLSGAFSKSYRLTEKYRIDRGITTTQITKQTYCRKIALSREKQAKEILKLQPLLKHEFLQLSYRKIRLQEAMEYISSTYELNSPQYSSRLIAIEQFDAMSQKDKDFTFTYKGGRLYTPCTSLARDLEQFTYFGGYEQEQSVSIDMPNSQLCFFSKYAKVHNIGNEDTGERDFAQTQEKFITKKANSIPSIPSSIPLPYVMNFSQWDNLIFKGQGYETMMSLYNWKGKKNGHTQEERQEFKAEFFGQLFYNSYKDVLTKMEQVFMFNFEADAKKLRDLKKVLGNRQLAIEVQTLEGNFFHNAITNYMINSRNYDIPFTIKHDSITLPMSEASHLIEELNKLVREFFGRKDISFKFDVL